MDSNATMTLTTHAASVQHHYQITHPTACSSTRFAAAAAATHTHTHAHAHAHARTHLGVPGIRFLREKVAVAECVDHTFEITP